MIVALRKPGTLPGRPGAGTAAALLLLGTVLASGPAWAQRMEEGVITERGTQFVTEPEPEPEPEPEQAPEAPPPEAPEPVPAPRAAAPEAPAEPAEPPRYPTVVFLLDTSDSMLNSPPGTPQRLLDQAKRALTRVIEGMSAETRAQLRVFNTRSHQVKLPGASDNGFVRMGEPGSTVRERFRSAIDRVRTAGGTNLYQAIVEALALFEDPGDQRAYRSGERFPVLVVVSDGEDWGKSRYTFEMVQKAKQEHPLVTINTIGFHIARDDRWLQRLCRIATRPEGCATAADEKQLQALLENFYQPPPS